MSWREVIVTTQCKLDYKMGYLVIRGEDVKRIFLDEIAMLIIENPAVSHGFELIMLESTAYSKCEYENRLIIDADLCEIA